MTQIRQTLVQGVFFVLLLAIAANTLLYTSKAANPLIISDGWFSVSAVVQKAANGELTAGDLFVKRNTLDHSQPLRKLILLLHYRVFDLDYSVEAIIGVLSAFLNLGLLWLMLRLPLADQPGDGLPGGGQSRPQWRMYLGFAALAAVYLSLNSSVVFYWPLLTLNYTSHLFVLLFLWAAWSGYRRADPLHLALLFAAALTMDVVADDTGLIASIAAMLVIGLHGARDRAWCSEAKAAGVILMAFLAYKLLVAGITSGIAPAAAGEGLGLRNLLVGLSNHADEAVDWVRVPLVASVTHRMQLRGLPGGDAPWIESSIAIVLGAAHVWFWWRACRGRRNLASFVASGLMLLFYGLLAGLLLARVSVQGVAYLWQPRYVLIYELNLVALLLMGLGQMGAAAGGGDSPPTVLKWLPATCLPLAAGLLLALQVPLSYYTWGRLKYLSATEQRLALQIGELAQHPEAVPGNCAPSLIICRYKPQQRNETINFLRSHRLNVFSPAFQRRHRLYPDTSELR